MSKKSKIFQTLSALGLPVSYSSSDFKKPKLVISFVSNTSKRLSNVKHDKHVRYQIMFYSEKARDVESDSDLLRVEKALEDAGLITTDWMEITDIDDDTELGYFDYLIEVR